MTDVQTLSDNLEADITHFLVDRLKHMECAYRYLPEDQQKAVIEDARHAARRLIEEVVQKVASDGMQVVPATLDKASNDGSKIVAPVQLPTTSEHRHALFDAVKQTVYLVLAEPEQYEDDGSGLPKPQPDQQSLA